MYAPPPWVIYSQNAWKNITKHTLIINYYAIYIIILIEIGGIFVPVIPIYIQEVYWLVMIWAALLRQFMGHKSPVGEIWRRTTPCKHTVRVNGQPESPWFVGSNFLYHTGIRDSNSRCENHDDSTNVTLLGSHHWKYTNSCNRLTTRNSKLDALS